MTLHSCTFHKRWRRQLWATADRVTEVIVTPLLLHQNVEVLPTIADVA